MMNIRIYEEVLPKIKMITLPYVDRGRHIRQIKGYCEVWKIKKNLPVIS